MVRERHRGGERYITGDTERGGDVIGIMKKEAIIRIGDNVEKRERRE